MAADSNRNALLEASRTPGYRKVKRVAPEQSPETPAGKAPDPDLGHALIRKERYTSREFMQLEWERMWTRTWLIAGRASDSRPAISHVRVHIRSHSSCMNSREV